MQAKQLTLQMEAGEARTLGRMQLVRAILSHLQQRHKAPPFKWYIANAVAQVCGQV